MSLKSVKQSFEIPAFSFTCGRTLPVRLGYETYGTLNEAKDNAILVVHYFSASSHCCGKYQESDPLPGFWDGLIGPGKAVDTEKYFGRLRRQSVQLRRQESERHYHRAP